MSNLGFLMKNMDAKLIMNVNQNKILENDDWIDEVLFTLQYIEKALNNPNKNIITEEEIIKIELIKALFYLSFYCFYKYLHIFHYFLKFYLLNIVCICNHF